MQALELRGRYTLELLQFVFMSVYQHWVENFVDERRLCRCVTLVQVVGLTRNARQRMSTIRILEAQGHLL